jgi:hypothetical protein
VLEDVQQYPCSPLTNSQYFIIFLNLNPLFIHITFYSTCYEPGILIGSGTLKVIHVNYVCAGSGKDEYEVHLQQCKFCRCYDTSKKNKYMPYGYIIITRYY